MSEQSSTEVLERKLEFLRKALAISSDASEQFELGKEIEAVERSLAEANAKEKLISTPQSEPQSVDNESPHVEPGHQMPAQDFSYRWTMGIISIFLAAIAGIVLYKMLNPPPTVAKPVIQSVKPGVAGNAETGFKWNIVIRFSTSGIPKDSQLKIEIAEDDLFSSVLSHEKPIAWTIWSSGQMIIGIPRQDIPEAHARIIVLNSRNEPLCESKPFHFLAPQE